MNTSRGGTFVYYDYRRHSFACRFCDNPLKGGILPKGDSVYITLTDREGHSGTYLICIKEECRTIALLNKDEMINTVGFTL